MLQSVALLALLFAQDEEVIQLKSGEIIKGKILKVDDKGIQIQPGSNQEIFFTYEQINAYSAYDVRRKRMNKESADDHLAMADFCKRFGLLAYASSHLKEALSRAPERKDEISKIQKSIRDEDAKQKLKTAKDIVDQKTEKRYDEAAKLLHDIIEKNSPDDSPYYEEARKLEERLTEEIKKLRKDRENQIEAARKQEEAARKEKESKEPIEKTSATLLEAEKLWQEGLDQEASNSTQRANAAWIAAEAKLLFAKANIDASAKKSKDPDVLRKLSEQNQAADKWLVRVYIALGRVAAAEGLDYLQSIRWINKALKIDPDNDKAFQLKLVVTEAAMRARIEQTRPR
jgi:tetratricopeptide (TPR) repeat protein